MVQQYMATTIFYHMAHLYNFMRKIPLLLPFLAWQVNFIKFNLKFEQVILH